MTEKSNTAPAPFVYAGLRVGIGNTLVEQLHPLRGNKLGEPMFFTANRKRRRRVVGGVYEGASFSETQASGLDAARYAREWTGADAGALLAEWTAKDEGASIEMKTLKLEADALKVNAIAAQLRTLRLAYAALRGRGDHSGCAALEGAVLRALRRAP